MALAAGLWLWACGEDAAPSLATYSIAFDVRAGAEAARCDRALTGLGTSSSTLALSDLRFYVYDFRLGRNDGAEEIARLVPDQKWQSADVALLDFEDKTGECVNGTAEMNMKVVVEAQKADYSGLRFTLGVPFSVNHLDLAAQSSPLNFSAMFWGWEGGFKFLKLDGASTGQAAFRVHLGSTGCTSGADGVVSSCSAENRAHVAIENFDPDSSTVVFDLAELFSSSNIDDNAHGTPPGCMSAPEDLDCAPIFDALGLSFGGQTASGGAKAFR